MKKRSQRGQSTLEYIILVTAVIAVAIIFLKPMNTSGGGGGVLANTVNDSYGQVVNGINTLTKNLLDTDLWK